MSSGGSAKKTAEMGRADIHPFLSLSSKINEVGVVSEGGEGVLCSDGN